MKKIFFIALCFSCLSNLFAHKVSINVKKVVVESNSENQFVSVTFDYKFKNESDKTIFLYDFEKGNYRQFENDVFLNNKVVKTVYVIKPSNIKNDWFGNACWGEPYLSSFKILPQKEQKGKIRTYFEIPNNIDYKKTEYCFNFIISSRPIEDLFKTPLNSPNPIFEENLCKNEFVSFLLYD